MTVFSWLMYVFYLMWYWKIYFEAPFSLTVIGINAFCLGVFMAKKELQNLEYCLVVMQTIVDLIFTGVLGLVYYFLDVWSAFVYFCMFSGLNFDWENVEEWTNKNQTY